MHHYENNVMTQISSFSADSSSKHFQNYTEHNIHMSNNIVVSVTLGLHRQLRLYWCTGKAPDADAHVIILSISFYSSILESISACIPLILILRAAKFL